uniref:Uncharacterized protein n=1 Tax=Bactrocera latifrons TaxID=174628 RepID=A0A0K8U3J8_BACLA
MENNSFKFNAYANELRMSAFINDENISDDAVSLFEATTYSETETLVQTVSRLRLRLRYLHLVECEHFRQIEAGLQQFQRMSLPPGGARIGCRARHSLNF